MKIARSVPDATFGAATSQTLLLRASRDILSGSTSPKTMISAPLRSLRRKNAELSTVASEMLLAGEPWL